MRESIIENILKNKIIAIIRGVYSQDCERLVESLAKGGIKMIEVTFDQAHPETFSDTAKSIAMINEKFNGEVLAGAGTVTTISLVETAQQAGAKYIISPNTDPEIIKHTLKLGMVSIPGAMTPTEVLNAHHYGADFVKVFPVSNIGLAKYIKSIRAPLNHIKLLAVGGVNEDNIADLLNAGAVGAGVGGNLVNNKWIMEGKFNEITALAKKLCTALVN